MSLASLQDDPSVDSFFNVVETETLALFEHLSFEFREEFDVFTPAETGRTRDHKPPEMMHGFLHKWKDRAESALVYRPEQSGGAGQNLASPRSHGNRTRNSE
jgi:hypothetical protein